METPHLQRPEAEIHGDLLPCCLICYPPQTSAYNLNVRRKPTVVVQTFIKKRNHTTHFVIHTEYSGGEKKPSSDELNCICLVHINILIIYKTMWPGRVQQTCTALIKENPGPVLIQIKSPSPSSLQCKSNIHRVQK